jgi:hypothetical protein
MECKPIENKRDFPASEFVASGDKCLWRREEVDDETEISALSY